VIVACLYIQVWAPFRQ